MSIEILKEEARRHEQRESWKSALDIYLKAIAKLESGKEPDITLYNRVGDLYTRLNQMDDAIEHYESAIGLYLDAGLPNNAIAVCKKILRNAPNRASTFLKMGQIWAEQGFIPDARQNFLTYAEIKMRTGVADEAFRALVEFADLAPEEVGVRMTVADQMESQGRVDAAIDQLQQARMKLFEQARAEEAYQVEARILDLDPNAVLPDMPEVATAAPDGEGEGGAQDWRTEDGVGGARGLPGFETTSLTAPPPPGPASPEGPSEPAVPPTPSEEVAAGEPEEDATPLPTLDAEEEGDEVPGDEPPAHEPRADQPPVDEPPADEPPRPARGDGSSFLVRGQDLLSLGHLSEGLAALDSAHRSFAEAGDLGQAMRVVREMILKAPDDPVNHQRLVEYALRSGDAGALVAARLELAECLVRNGDPDGAGKIYREVLEVDPGNLRALEGLGEDRPLGSQAPEPPQERDDKRSDYVDLGTLILDSDREKTTRWTVTADAPSGDEDADFAKMLAQFKEKVAENLEFRDVKARHDLGTAYKEMGLLDEAIAQFQDALRADPAHLPTYELLGQCFLEQGRSDVAIRSMERALNVPRRIEDEMLGIYYNLGRAHENVGREDEAVEFYEKVFALDINFMDVTERLRNLRQS
jgi:tetratricopeptide (TPR) repeat protein